MFRADGIYFRWGVLQVKPDFRLNGSDISVEMNISLRGSTKKWENLFIKQKKVK